MNIKYLETVFKNAKENGLDVCVEVTIPGQNDTEFIEQKRQHWKQLAYYKKTYDENLIHNHCNEIKIVNIRKIKFEEEN